MENGNFTIVLGSLQKNTFEIIDFILKLLESTANIYIPEAPLPVSRDVSGNLMLKIFNWDRFDETFPNINGEQMVLLLSPEHNLAEQFQRLTNIHEHTPIQIAKIISIIDHVYFDGRHSNLLDAMAYFSDILLIDNRQEIDHNCLKIFIEHCKQKECYPLSIKILSKNLEKSMPELLDNRPRRMTLIFDDLDPIDFIDEEMVGTEPFTIPTLAQRDKYLKKDIQGHYCLPIEFLEYESK